MYGKRGAGESGGEHESAQSVSGGNMTLLAKDAAAALQLLSRHPALEDDAIGLTGISQAGWLVALAAEHSGLAQFLVMWSAPVCKVSEEDICSKHTDDADGDVIPSYEDALNARSEPYVWPDFLGRDTDPGESLAKLEIPGLWIFGARDDRHRQRLDTAHCRALTDARAVALTWHRNLHVAGVFHGRRRLVILRVVSR